MKLHLLRYFSVLAEELHFSRAAEKLAITQPPLSSAIKALEEELGVPLLSRSSKHVELTPAGMAFLSEARNILERVARAENVVKAVAEGKKGRLEIGMTGSLVYREVPTIVRHFNRTQPEVDLVLHELSTVEQLEALAHGHLDAGFVNILSAPPKLKALQLADDEFVLCLPQAHAFAEQSQVSIKALVSERFIMFARNVSPANYDNVIAIFHRAGIHPCVMHAARQWLTIVAMVANHLGVSIVPHSLAQSKVSGVRFVRIRGSSNHAPASLVWDPARSNPALENFVSSAILSISDKNSIAQPDPASADRKVPARAR